MSLSKSMPRESHEESFMLNLAIYMTIISSINGRGCFAVSEASCKCRSQLNLFFCLKGSLTDPNAFCEYENKLAVAVSTRGQYTQNWSMWSIYRWLSTRLHYIHYLNTGDTDNTKTKTNIEKLNYPYQANFIRVSMLGFKTFRKLVLRALKIRL